MKLWDKGFAVNEKIENFTVGKDRELDALLAIYDVQGTKAHANMLAKAGLLTDQENRSLQQALDDFTVLAKQPGFVIEHEYEDIHSKLEDYLIQKCGDAGKKVHTARSRNDQVLTAVQLFNKDYLQATIKKIIDLIDILLEKAEENKEVLLPGYTHFQAGMPSSFGLWFAGYAENLMLDLEYFVAAYHVADYNPLGSGAGYGSSFPIDRDQTTEELGFSNLLVAATSAQILRGRLERTIAIALNMAASTLSKMSYDLVLYNSQDLGFVKLPQEMTTGSSIMPHKKNPDVFELCRAQCNGLQSVIGTISLVSNNLPGGYHRDYQYLKECIVDPMLKFHDILDILIYAMPSVEVSKDIVSQKKYDTIYTVENINKLIQQGIPFRDAYKQVAQEVGDGTFEPVRDFKTTHVGSIHNLGLERLRDRLEAFISKNAYEK